MWIALFTIVCADVICLSGAMIVSRSTSDGFSPDRRNKRSIIAEFVAEFVLGCQDLSRLACVSFEPKGFGARDATPAALRADIADTRLLGRPIFSLQNAPARHHRMESSPDIGLLLRRMAVLNIEADEVDSADPLRFRELQGHCTLCQSKGPCAYDLAHDAAGAGFRDWREYCPNVATLSLLSRIDHTSSRKTFSAIHG